MPSFVSRLLQGVNDYVLKPVVEPAIYYGNYTLYTMGWGSLLVGPIVAKMLGIEQEKYGGPYEDTCFLTGVAVGLVAAPIMLKKIQRNFPQLKPLLQEFNLGLLTANYILHYQHPEYRKGGNLDLYINNMAIVGSMMGPVPVIAEKLVQRLFREFLEPDNGQERIPLTVEPLSPAARATYQHVAQQDMERVHAQ